MTQPTFFVLDNDGNYVAATYATDSAGNPIPDTAWGKTYYGNDGTYSVVDSSNKYYVLYDQTGNPLAQQNTNGYLIAPLDYNIANQINQAQNFFNNNNMLIGEAGFLGFFAPGSDGDLQQTYDNGEYGTAFVRAFTDVGAFNYGVVAAAAQISPDNSYGQAGALNFYKSFNTPSIDTSGYSKNPVRNTITIEQGYKYYHSITPGSKLYDFSVPEQYQTPSKHSENEAPFNGNPNIILTNYSDGSSSLFYVNPNSQTANQTASYTGADASGVSGVTTASYNDGSSAVWNIPANGETQGAFYGPTGSVSFVTNQQQNGNGTTTFNAAANSGGSSVTSPSIDSSQVVYNGNGAFTFGSPQADANGLVNQLGVTGSFGISNLTVTNPTTGATATVALDNGSSTTLLEGRSVATGVPNEQAVTTEPAGQVDDAIFGQGAVANISGASINLEAGSSSLVAGSNNTITQANNTGSNITLDGTGNVVTGDSGNDAVFLQGDGSTAGIYGDGVVQLQGSNESVAAFDPGMTVATINGVTNETVTESGGTFYPGTGFSGVLLGSGDTILAQADSGSTIQAEGQYLTVGSLTGNDVFELAGSGSNATVYGGGGTIIVTDNNQTVSDMGGSTIAIADGVTGTVVYANDATVNEGQNDTVDVVGTGDQVDGNSTDVNTGAPSGYDPGGYSPPNGYSPPVGYNPPPDNPPPYYPYGGNYGGGGYYGGGYPDLARNAPALNGKGSSISEIAAYDKAIGAPSGSKEAEAGLAQAVLAYDSTGDQGAATTAVVTGSQWQPATAADGSRTITWSFAAGGPTATDPFSSFIGAQYQATVEQALQAWSNATGITFQQVADSSSSNIRIGFGAFDTASTGVLGITHDTTANGAIQSAVIRLEDPSQTALASGGTDAAYAGTGATLYQVALHEVGRALGFADNADANSVMFAASTSSNQSLDATDIAGAALLYGGPGPGTAPATATASADMAPVPAASPSIFGLSDAPAPVSGASNVHQMIQAMATLTPQASASTPPPVAQNNALATQLAAPLHS